LKKERDRTRAAKKQFAIPNTYRNASSSKQNDQEKEQKCHGCGKVGHFVRNCKAKGARNGFNWKAKPTEVAFRDLVHQEAAARDAIVDLKDDMADRLAALEDYAQKVNPPQPPIPLPFEAEPMQVPKEPEIIPEPQVKIKNRIDPYDHRVDDLSTFRSFRWTANDWDVDKLRVYSSGWTLPIGATDVSGEHSTYKFRIKLSPLEFMWGCLLLLPASILCFGIEFLFSLPDPTVFRLSFIGFFIPICIVVYQMCVKMVRNYLLWMPFTHYKVALKYTPVPDLTTDKRPLATGADSLVQTNSTFAQAKFSRTGFFSLFPGFMCVTKAVRVDLVSLSKISQLTAPNNMLMLSTNENIKARLEYSMAHMQKINHDESHPLLGFMPNMDEVLVAYGIWRRSIQRRDKRDF